MLYSHSQLLLPPLPPLLDQGSQQVFEKVLV
jgi:hypothetical protein